jgi:hypothetical protein
LITHGGSRSALCALACAALVIAVPARLHAQRTVVSGVVLDDQTRAPVAEAAVRLLNTTGRALISVATDANGNFRFTIPEAGLYRIRAERIGYAVNESGSIMLQGPTAYIELRLTPQAVVLDSLVIKGEQQRPRALRPSEQLIVGKLLDDDTRRPLVSGTIALIDAKGKQITTAKADAAGNFRIVSPQPGTYRLRGEHQGYRTAESPQLKLMLGDSMRMDFHLSTSVVLLSPIVVTASARRIEDRSEQKGMEGFYTRMKRFGKSGFGDIVTRDEIADYDKRGMTTLGTVNMRNTRLRETSTCAPPYSTDYYVDGAPFMPPDSMAIDGQFPLHLIEALEVYLAPNIPGEFLVPMIREPGDRLGKPHCRIIVIWTKR